MRLKVATFILPLLTLLSTSAYGYYDDDGFITIEDEPDAFEKPVRLMLSNLKHKRILWPNRPDTADLKINRTTFTKVLQEGLRTRRYLKYSYPQSPIVDMMMQSIAPSYQPSNAKDPFDFLRDTYPLPKGFSQPLDEYDYIIIGGGTAGSVVASRLTEDKPKATVLVIEVGKPESLLNDVPALLSYMQLTDYVEPYTMEHQPGVCLGSEKQRCFWPRGKALGGTSVINYMLYTRGRPQDWDRIAADGNYGWSYNEILPYYIKSENADLKKYKDLPYRGRNGEVSVENVPFRTGLAEAFLKAGRSFGIPTVDYNSPFELGFGYTQATISKGHRCSAAKAYLHQHKKRKNLHILTEAKATKIIIDSQTKRAYAVNYIKNGIQRTVRARREIILSAGPIASPQLLMLSGIGPQEHLQALGIPVLANLQVGRTLYDHICFPGVIFKLNTTNASLLEPKVATLDNLIQWLQFGDGLLTTTGGVEGIGYIRTSISDDPENIPDIELLSLGGSINIDSGGALIKSWRLSDKTYGSGIAPLNGKDTWSGVVMLTQPKSKGYLELRDTNPFSHPKLYGNYLTDPRDIAAIKEAVQFVIKLGESDAFQKYNPKLHIGDYHTCKHTILGSEEYWDCAIRTLMVTLHHQIATCKMGPETDPYAVVDPELRVYGISGLRVADSSIIPRPTCAHTAAPAYMIGEKAADLIKNAWKNIV